MDRQLILNSYIQAIIKDTDKLRENYPNAMAREIIEMEKGYRFCTTKSVEWLENFLKIIEAATTQLEAAGS
jgi:allantoicase